MAACCERYFTYSWAGGSRGIAMFWRKRRSADDFAQEIQSHLEYEANQLRESRQGGNDPDASARRRFGNVTSVQEKLYEHGRWLPWDNFLRDFQYALRLVR